MCASVIKGRIMLATTVDAMKALLKTDPVLTPGDRARILASIRNHGLDSETLRPAPAQEKGSGFSPLGRLQALSQKIEISVVQGVVVLKRHDSLGFLRVRSQIFVTCLK